MLRSAATRVGVSGARALSTNSSGAPPPSGGRFVRRATPLLLTGGTAGFVYKVATDDEFRGNVEKSFPAATQVLEKIPRADPLFKSSDGGLSSAGSASDAVTDTKHSKSTLPPNYETVPQLLQKIEASKKGVANADSSVKRHDPISTAQFDDGAPPPESTPLERMTPTERAAARVAEKGASERNNVDDEMPSERSIADTNESTASVSVPVDVEEVVKTIPVAESLPLFVESTSDDTDSGRKIAEEKAYPPSSGKGKLARLIGKGDYRTEDVDGPDVVDDSEYKKPELWGSYPAKSTSKSVAVGEVKSEPKIAKSVWQSASVSESADVSLEVQALRKELESQTKWEAVRLQEAVRAQMVEDNKATAKDLALVVKKHEEELARVREDALAQADKVLSERTADMKRRTLKERDEELAKLLKEKEEALREATELEYAEKERAQSTEREHALVEAKVQVTTLSELFDGLAVQTQKAKEAASRASVAFLLRETVSHSRPLGDQLAEAAGDSELGALVADSLPASCVKHGAQSVDELKERFGSASRRGLSVAMVPESAAGSMWGQLLGTVFSRLKVTVEGAEGAEGSNEGRIRRAGWLVREGDIGGAIVALEGLRGLSRDVMADWIAAAKARVASDLAAEVLLADAIIAQVVLSGCAPQTVAQ